MAQLATRILTIASFVDCTGSAGEESGVAGFAASATSCPGTAVPAVRTAAPTFSAAPAASPAAAALQLTLLCLALLLKKHDELWGRFIVRLEAHDVLVEDPKVILCDHPVANAHENHSLLHHRGLSGHV
eukprot:CAMPEP_0170618538 /NCGR_PEP_ID=MMETSP0224-20130122/27013_1 /TAXON_ID=285029 /ORGANISM="Togula jolla, Strain CCCM 725" /LENGTH=128 /DNA_ID=CAMNT_0010944521 /DNA_START=216 /DNA_END=604 /DNA_ORIENTATION=+